MNRPNHIIEKVVIEVTTSKLETAHAIQNNISEFLRNEMFPRLEVLFDAFNLNETVVRFDQIDLNIPIAGQVDFNRIKQELSKTLENKLKLHLQPVLGDLRKEERDVGWLDDEGNNQGIQIISGSRNREDAFLFFLERGCLPWFAQESQISSFVENPSWEKNLENAAFIEKLIAVLVRRAAVVDRFVNQFSDEIVLAFLVKINPKIEKYKKQANEVLSKNETTSNPLFLKLLLQLSLQPETTLAREDLQLYFREAMRVQYLDSVKSASSKFMNPLKILLDLLPDNGIHDSLMLEAEQILRAKNQKGKDAMVAFSKVDQNDEIEIVPKGKAMEENQLLQKEMQASFFENANDEIAVQNAGLILLHPFLKHFFVKTGIADKQGNLPKEKLDLAVQSLHFLATGNENIFEGSLVFEKFLCGLPLKMPVKRQSLLNDEIRSEAGILLKEAIANWKALKNSSPNDLRQLFIQREGKLMQQENKYKLVVERKAQDILLERISWNISMLKLPWRKELIVVEW